MKKCGARAVSLALSAGLSQWAGAHDPDTGSQPATAPRFELTPFIGYQFGGSFDVQMPQAQASEEADIESHGAYAAAFDMGAAPGLQYELFYSRQPTEIRAGQALPTTSLDVEYLHFGGTALFGESQFIKPYSIGSIGVTRLSLDAPDASDETPFSISIGIGLRVPVKPRFDIRLEARAFVSFLESDTAVFCNSGSTGASCVLKGNGSLFTQYALLAGAAFSF